MEVTADLHLTQRVRGSSVLMISFQPVRLPRTIPSDGNGQVAPQLLGHKRASLGSDLGGSEQRVHLQMKLYVAESAACLWTRGKVVSM